REGPRPRRIPGARSRRPRDHAAQGQLQLQAQRRARERVARRSGAAEEPLPHGEARLVRIPGLAGLRPRRRVREEQDPRPSALRVPDEEIGNRPMMLPLALLVLVGFAPQAKTGLAAWDTGKSSPSP